MTGDPRDWIGRPIETVPTPVLVLDLDAFDRNARTIATDLQRLGVDWRPHAKAHVSPALATRQIELGAIGVTCATIAEAAVMVSGGIKRVLVANELGTSHTAAIAASLQAAAEVIVCVDSPASAALLADAGQAAGTVVPVMIEVDIGMARAGVSSHRDLVALATRVAATRHLRLVGIMGYEGHTLDLAPPAAKAAAIQAAIRELLAARDALVGAGFDITVVSCGGTGSYRQSATIPGVTEIQAGGGCFDDRFYAEACGVNWLEPALTVHATVTSRPAPDRAIVDAGMKSMSTSDGAPRALLEGVTVAALFAEHGKLDLDGSALSLHVGDRLAFIPGYSDSTTMLHAGFVAIRNGVVDTILPRPVRWPL